MSLRLSLGAAFAAPTRSASQEEDPTPFERRLDWHRFFPSDNCGTEVEAAAIARCCRTTDISIIQSTTTEDPPVASARKGAKGRNCCDQCIAPAIVGCFVCRDGTLCCVLHRLDAARSVRAVGTLRGRPQVRPCSSRSSLRLSRPPSGRCSACFAAVSGRPLRWCSRRTVLAMAVGVPVCYVLFGLEPQGERRARRAALCGAVHAGIGHPRASDPGCSRSRAGSGCATDTDHWYGPGRAGGRGIDRTTRSAGRSRRRLLPDRRAGRAQRRGRPRPGTDVSSGPQAAGIVERFRVNEVIVAAREQRGGVVADE